MKTSLVTIALSAALADATSVRATGSYKQCQIKENKDNPTETLLVQLRQDDGTYSDEIEYAPGAPVTMVSYNDILAKPQDYCGIGYPATADAYAKIRTKSGSPCVVKLVELTTTSAISTI